MTTKRPTSLDVIRAMLRGHPAAALIVGAILGPPPGLDPPHTAHSSDEVG